MNRDDLLIELALVSQWVFLEKYGLAYRLKNGNFGMQFNDKTQIYMFLENGVEMVSYIPRDASAQQYFKKGSVFSQ
jgi:hypothetical protein